MKFLVICLVATQAILLGWSSYVHSPTHLEVFHFASGMHASGSRFIWLVTLGRWTCIPFVLLGSCVCFVLVLAMAQNPVVEAGIVAGSRAWHCRALEVYASDLLSALARPLDCLSVLAAVRPIITPRISRSRDADRLFYPERLLGQLRL